MFMHIAQFEQKTNYKNILLKKKMKPLVKALPVGRSFYEEIMSLAYYVHQKFSAPDNQKHKEIEFNSLYSLKICGRI